MNETGFRITQKKTAIGGTNRAKILEELQAFITIIDSLELENTIQK